MAEELDLNPKLNSEDVFETHERACAEGRETYLDPAAGFVVFTRLALEQRGRCCGCGCRHCPFGHERVKNKAARIQQPAFLHERVKRKAPPTHRDVLFWSGGKDSLLALRAWLQRSPTMDAREKHEGLNTVTLLTTFDAATRTVAHQEVSAETIRRQAEALDLDLLGVPLHSGANYLDRVGAGLDFLASRAAKVRTLIFGDLHLAHIRSWREKELSRFGIPLAYPLWHVPATALHTDLEASGVSCVVSACRGKPHDRAAPKINVGTAFGRRLSDEVQAHGWDPFGEEGEFHTVAEVWKIPAERALGMTQKEP